MSKRRRKDCQQRSRSASVAAVPDHHSQSEPFVEVSSRRATVVVGLPDGRLGMGRCG
ncbi:hypothetical protein ABTY98_38060 [Streptomyces sp. NPDC096040]|uniref:hypothetical protein n=1 Tax=Streptomyces sp. NPDC096040 TaxID=3155541 RepID=UPI003321DC70